MTADDPIAEWRRFGLAHHGRVAIVGFRDAAIPIELDQIFVPLQVHADPRRPGSAEVSFDEALARASHGRTCLALIGDPGAGKTTLLRHLFRRAALGELTGPVAHLRGLHPVLVRLATVADAELVPRGLRAIIARVSADDGYPEAGQVLLASPNQGFLFLLDGLDEVRDEPTRERLCTWLNKEVDHWPACGFVVTSRRAAWARTPALGARFLPVSVLGMRGPERELYVRRWFRAVVRHFWGAVDRDEAVEARAQAQATALLDVLSRGAWRSHPRLLEMVANPLMLSTLCLAHYNDTRLPEQRGALYERTLGLLIEVWTRERVGGPTLRLESTRLVLQPLAHAMHEQDRRELSVAEAAALVGPLLAQVPQVHAVAATPERFLDLVRDECGVLKSRDLGHIEFVHLSFQEYLAACHVAARGLGRQLADHAEDPRWEEVILLAMSRDGVFEPFMTRVLERGDFDLALLRQCLREASQIIPEPFEAAADRLQARLRAPAGPLSRLGRWFLGRPAPPTTEDDLRRLFELVTGFDLPGMVERARSFVDSDDRALRAAARNFVGLKDPGQPFVERTTGMTFAWIPGGTFLMGSSRTPGAPGYDSDARDNEMPAYHVQLTGFWMGVYPVTNEQYARFMADTGQPAPESFSNRRFNDPAQPVVTVSWDDAAAFTRWLTGKLAGFEARLPTEAEWEYAARGTDGRRYPWGNKQPKASQATFDLADDCGRPAVVGHTPSGMSPFGVHDLAGNVREWCLDAWGSYPKSKTEFVDPYHIDHDGNTSRVVRSVNGLRAALRDSRRPQHQYLDVGFRVVCGGSLQISKGLEIGSRLSTPSPEELRADAIHFLEAAGFMLTTGDPYDGFDTTSESSYWRARQVQRRLFTKIVSGRPLTGFDVLSIHASAMTISHEISQAFVILNGDINDDAWLQRATLRVQGFNLMPIPYGLLYEARTSGKSNFERRILSSHLDRFLGATIDPYDVLHPVSDSLNFFGRESIAETLGTQLASGTPLGLFGLRKMGKSSLLRYLQQRLPFPTALLDLEAGIDPAITLQGAIRGWNADARARFSLDLSFNLDAVADQALGPELLVRAIEDTLDRYATRLPHGRLAILLDEIELLTPTAGTPKDEWQQQLGLMRSLRGLVQEDGRISLLVAGADPAIVRTNRWDTHSDPNPFFQFLQEIHLGPLVLADCEQMIRSIGCQVDLKYMGRASTLVAQMSGGHPSIARQLASLAFQLRSRSRELDESSIQQAVSQFIDDPKYTAILVELWNEVIREKLWGVQRARANRDILFALAEAQDSVSSADLATGEGASEYRASLYELARRHIIQSVSPVSSRTPPAYKITFPLFQRWIRQHLLNLVDN